MLFPSIHILLVTAPESLCCEAEQWSRTARFLRDRLLQRFGGDLVIDEVQAYTSRFQQFPSAVALLGENAQLPAVLVQGVLVAQGGKLQFRAIEQAVQAALAAHNADTLSPGSIPDAPARKRRSGRQHL